VATSTIASWGSVPEGNLMAYLLPSLVAILMAYPMGAFLAFILASLANPSFVASILAWACLLGLQVLVSDWEWPWASILVSVANSNCSSFYLVVVVSEPIVSFNLLVP